MKNANLSSWAEDFDLEDLNEEADKYNLSMNLIQEAREVVTRSFKSKPKKSKHTKARKECWQ